ncbi:rCG22721 [Rattus norvegicus]|uniref:RCG22721 n=1 Tax=Rattus norvegicus TaxID=10116 RepID=A6JYI9_RAT|nr:rCG22721 [Rattus norvegicus]
MGFIRVDSDNSSTSPALKHLQLCSGQVWPCSPFRMISPTIGSIHYSKCLTPNEWVLRKWES